MLSSRRLRSLAALLFLGATAPAFAQSKIFVNEFYRNGTLTTQDEWVEVVLRQDLTATELEGFYIGDSATARASKFSGYKFTGMSAYASTFKAGTIIVMAGATGPALDTTYDPANGDWNLVLRTSGSNFTANGNGGDLAGTDVVYVDTNGTSGNAALSPDGFSVTWPTATGGAFGDIASVRIAAPNNTSGAVLTSDFAGATTTANWNVSVLLASMTAGQPNGGNNTTYIESLRTTVPQPTLAIDDVTLAEGDAGVTAFDFTVTLTNAAAGPFTVSYTTSDGSATEASNDYETASGTLSFDGTAGETETITVTVNGDTDSEGDETFNVTLSNPSLPAVQLGDATGVGTIDNDDVVPPDLTIANATLAEGNSGTSTLSFAVTLSAASANDVTFTASTVDGTATEADGDYEPLAAAPFTITAGNTSVNVNVTINGDIRGEANETFTVNLANVSGANGLDVTATGTIDNDDRYLVWQLQGAGFCSPLITSCNQAADVAGPAVQVRASVVTAVGPSGFYIQTPSLESDNVAGTSDGIYVLGTAAVAVGDLVEVDGTLREFFGMTEISPATAVTVVGTGAALPPAVEFSDAADRPSKNPAALSCPGTGPGAGNNANTNFECFEGMLVNIVDGITTTGNQTFGSDPYAEVHIGTRGERAYREQGTRFPANPAAGASEAGQWDFNPEVLEMDADALGAFPTGTEIVGGVEFAGQGVIAYEFSDYEFWPVAGPRFTLQAADNVLPRPARARIDDTELTIGSFNAFRLCDIVKDELIDPDDEILFDCDADVIEAGGEPAYQNKLDKVSAYIRTVLNSPDVVGMQEVEKLVVLQDLATRIAEDGGPSYTAYLVEGHDPGGIDVGFLVRGDRITNAQVEQLRADETWQDGANTDFLHDRPPLLLRAQFNGNAGRPLQFAVMVNHTRSFDTAQRGHAKRHLQAKAIAEEVQAYQTNVVNALRPLILVGDHNAYQFSDGFTDPIGLISGTHNDESTDCTFGIYTCDKDAVPDAANPDAAQIVFPPLVKGVDIMAMIDEDEVYSYIFTETVNNTWGQNRDLPTSQVIDHLLLTQAADPLLVDFAYGRANVDASRLGFNSGSGPGGPDLAIGSSDHDGFVAYFGATCTADVVNDPDGDSICTIVDNCPNASNPGQQDFDGDGLGDACDPNVAPTISDTADRSSPEDAVVTVNFTIGDAESTLDCATAVTASSSDDAVVPDAQIVISGTEPDCTATITPAAHGNGNTTITFTVSDGQLTAQDSFVLTVTPVNDPPSFTLPAGTTANEDQGAVTVPGFATAISAGPNEPTQTVAFQRTGNTNPALFSAQPVIASDGTLTFTTAPGASGTATITVVLVDSLGASSAPQSFTITIAGSNDAPAFTGEPYAFELQHGAPNGTAVGTVTATDVDAGDTLTFAIQASTLPGALTIDAATGAITVANSAQLDQSVSTIQLTVTVTDGDGASDTATVTVTLSSDGGELIFEDGFED